MSSQEKKAYLSRYPVLDKEIERKSRELALWQQKSFQTGSEQMKRLEMDMAEDIMRLASLKKKVEGLIRSVGNDTYRLLLECRYIDGRTWEETAEFMHYSWQHLHRLHNRALEELVIE